MSDQILDGRAKFGCSVDEFYRRAEIAPMLARHGILKPPAPSDVATDAAPALARINPLHGVARWIADCPDCRVGASYVWLATPRMLCTNCGNRTIGARWRPVALPDNRQEIERLLLARDDPMMRGWSPGETLDALREQNAALAVGKGGLN